MATVEAVRTEKIEELLLAWMHPVLKHSGFSQRFRFLLLKQNLRLEITCQPSAATSGFNNNNPRKGVKRATQRTGNRNREHLHHKWMIGADDGTSIGDSKKPPP